MMRQKMMKELTEAPFKIVAANLGLASDIVKGRPLSESVSTFLHRMPFADQMSAETRLSRTEATAQPVLPATRAPANIVAAPGVADAEDSPANAEPVKADAAPEGDEVHPQVELAQKAARIAEENAEDRPKTRI